MYRVGEFVFDYHHAILIKNGQPKNIEPQLNELLKLFVEHSGELVPKELIIETLWPNRIITDDAFRAVIKKLRKSLGDNAKSPLYIRTIPTKGFILIAEVDERLASKKLSSVQNYARYFAFAFFLVSLLVIWFWNANENNPIKIEKLTTLSGSEVSPTYNPGNRTLVFSHRANKDDYLQLYSKSLDSGKVMRLTFDKVNYANAHFSATGNRLAFTTSTPDETSIVVAKFSKTAGLTDWFMLPKSVANKRYLQAWAANEEGLYLSDIQKTNKPQSIWYYHFESQKMKSITSPSGSGQGDFFATESNDSQSLAVLRNVDANNTELLIQHLNSGELTHIQNLPQNFSRLVWSEDGRSIKLSSFNGNFAWYSLDTKRLELTSISQPYINDVFFSCGDNCIFARQHNGNYLDLNRQPNPFITESIRGQDHIELSGAEDLPVFGHVSEKMYFVRQLNQETQVVVADDNRVSVLQRLDKNSLLTSLQVNKKESHLAGVADGRLFLIDLSTRKFHYLSTELEQIANIYWQEGNLHYTRIEHSNPVLYRYEAESKTKVRIAEGVFAQLKLSGEHSMIIDNQLKVWRTAIDGSTVFITELASVSANRWKIQNNHLYFTRHEENLAYLNRINLDSTELNKVFLAKNRYRLSFDLSSDGQTMMAVRSVLAQSNLVKVTY